MREDYPVMQKSKMAFPGILLDIVATENGSLYKDVITYVRYISIHPSSIYVKDLWCPK